MKDKEATNVMGVTGYSSVHVPWDMVLVHMSGGRNDMLIRNMSVFGIVRCAMSHACFRDDVIKSLGERNDIPFEKKFLIAYNMSSVAYGSSGLSAISLHNVIKYIYRKPLELGFLKNKVVTLNDDELSSVVLDRDMAVYNILKSDSPIITHILSVIFKRRFIDRVDSVEWMVSTFDIYDKTVESSVNNGIRCQDWYKVIKGKMHLDMLNHTKDWYGSNSRIMNPEPSSCDMDIHTICKYIMSEVYSNFIKDDTHNDDRYAVTYPPFYNASGEVIILKGIPEITRDDMTVTHIMMNKDINDDLLKSTFIDMINNPDSLLNMILDVYTDSMPKSWIVSTLMECIGEMVAVVDNVLDTNKLNIGQDVDNREISKPILVMNKRTKKTLLDNIHNKLTQ